MTSVRVLGCNPGCCVEGLVFILPALVLQRVVISAKIAGAHGLARFDVQALALDDTKC